MNIQQLEREIRMALHRLMALEANRQVVDPTAVLADRIWSALDYMREVIGMARETEDIVRANIDVQNALQAQPSTPITGNLAAGDIQDVVAAWQSLMAWLDSPIDVAVPDGTTRQVTPRQVIYRMKSAYTIPQSSTDSATPPPSDTEA